MDFLNRDSGVLDMNADQMRSLLPALGARLERFRPCFARVATFQHLKTYLAGLMSDLKRKSIEPIALAGGVAVRTLQEFLAFFVWDEVRVDNMMQQMVVDEFGSDDAIGVLDACASTKQGDKIPGVQRQWCGERGKIENCVVGQHLLYTDNHPENPFTGMLASDLYLPKSWTQDRERCRAAKIPDDVEFRTKWQIGLDQVALASRNGVRFSWITFDEDYGGKPLFWYCLDAMGQRGIGEVPKNFMCWTTRPACKTFQGPHAAKKVANVCRYSPVFIQQGWRTVNIKQTTRGSARWEIKSARVHLQDTTGPVPVPTDRQYWLIVAHNPTTDEYKYFVSNAAAGVSVISMLRAAFARWHVEKWFERAKQEAGFGAFEVRTYKSLIRHWLCSRIVMFFLASETQRLRGEKSVDHAGADRGCGQHPRFEDLEAISGSMAGADLPMRVLSGA